MITHTMSKKSELTPDEYARLVVYILGYGAKYLLDEVNKEAGHGVALMAADEIEACKDAVEKRLSKLVVNWDIVEVMGE